MDHSLGPICRRETLSEQVYLELKTALMQGRFPAGSKLAIRPLSQRLGTSPTPVREAIVRLAAQNALDAGANKSIRVPTRSLEKLAEINRIRSVLEGMAAASAAEPPIGNLEGLLVSIYGQILSALEDRDPHRASVAKMQFFLSIYNASRMPTLLATIENLWLQIGPYLNLIYVDMAERQEDEFPFSVLIDRISEHDSDGVRQMIEKRVHQEGLAMLRLEPEGAAAEETPQKPVGYASRSKGIGQAPVRQDLWNGSRHKDIMGKLQ